jgi:membrane-bound lytic murein transglycosylase B
LLAAASIWATSSPASTAIRGSYEGALGWPQFLPSIWIKFAVDFDGAGRIDLL